MPTTGSSSGPPSSRSGGLRVAIVDGHAHVWALDPDVYPWQPTFGYVPTEPAKPEALLAVMDRVGITHAILVQPSVYGSDHRFLLDTVRAHPDRFLPIGLVDPADPTEGWTPASLVSGGGCVGLRVNLSLDPRYAEIQAGASRWAELEALDVPICLRATPAHHELVKRVLARHPRLRLVVDHLGLPDRGPPAATLARLTELAQFEHCWLKIAGLGRLSRATVPHRDIWWLVRAALRLFGSARVLWGSDFPTADPDGGYLGAVRTIESMPFLRGADRDRLMAGTARLLWGLPPERPTL